MYCGIDVIEVKRVKDAINKVKKFKENIFSAKEIEEIEKISTDFKFQRYAGRFAAKEAVYKAISKILIQNSINNINFCDIEIENDTLLKSRPKVNILDENANNILCKWNIDVSISHIESIAMAEAVVTKK